LSAGPALDSLREVIDFRRLPPRGGAATCLRASPADRIMLLSSVSYAQTCSVYQLKIGSKRDVVLSDLQKRGCDVKLNAPKNGLERAVVLLKDNEEYAYHELYFTDGKLFSLWSCSSWFTSAEKAFGALYKELAMHSSPDRPERDKKSILGQRKVDGRVLLQKPVLEEVVDKIIFDVDDGSIFLNLRTGRDGGTSVQVSTVRNRWSRPSRSCEILKSKSVRDFGLFR